MYYKLCVGYNLFFICIDWLDSKNCEVKKKVHNFFFNLIYQTVWQINMPLKSKYAFYRLGSPNNNDIFPKANVTWLWILQDFINMFQRVSSQIFSKLLPSVLTHFLWHKNRHYLQVFQETRVANKADHQ